MKIGLSSYCFSQAMNAGQLDIIQVIEQVAAMGGEHVEIVPIGYNLSTHPELIDEIKQKASSLGLDISNYAIGANFSGLEDEAFEQEIARVMKEVDIAAALGVKLMRHDVASSKDISIKHFNSELPRLAEACRRIADYASTFGITTSVENHGFYIQASDRVQALIHEVDRPNFKTTLDVGNFLCADEDPVAAVRNNIAYASIVHFKDFYRRAEAYHPGEGWFRSTAGYYLRGAIVGQGDIDIRALMRIIRDSGYEGYLSIEFEGMEPCIKGTKIALDNVKRLWDEVNSI